MTAKHQNAFTLTEILIVIAIIGAITVAGTRYYHKTVEQQRVKAAILNLSAIHSAQEIFKANNGEYWPILGTGQQNIDEINFGLELNISEDGVTYTCQKVSPTQYSCQAVRSGPATAFVVSLTQAPLTAINPVCKSNCP